MNLFQISKDQLKSISQNKMKLAAIAAIIIIPLLYTFFYLKAYWDPYGNLKNYNIAVVNKDKGASLDGKEQNYGNDVVKSLRDKKDIGFKFVSEEEANKGLMEDRYFSEIQIPEDFSKKISNAKNGNAEAPKLIFLSNNKKNYIGTKISEAIKNELLNEVKKSVSGEYGEIAFDSIYELRDGLKDATKGTEKLYDGTNKLYDGSEQLTDGLNRMNKEVPSLQNGVSTLTTGSSGLNKGLGQLNEKLPELSSGTNRLSSGAKSLNDGVGTLEEGVKQLTDKSDDLKNGSNNLVESYNNNLIPGYVQMANGLKTGADTLNYGTKQIQGGINGLVNSMQQSQVAMGDAQKQLEAYLAAHPEAMSDPNMQAFLSTLQNISQQANNPDSAKNIQALQSGINGLVDGTTTLSNQLDINNQNSAAGRFYSGLNTFNTEGIQPYTIGVNKYVNGVNSLAMGVNTLSQGSSQLANGLVQLNSNMPSLQNASNQLYDGSSKLTNGLGELNNQIPTLASGVSQLADGSSKLNNGLGELKNGTKELGSGLKDGVEKVDNNVKTPSKQLGDFIGDPIKVDENNINPINNYGSGLAPYFLPISIWLGAVFMFLIIKIKNNDYEEMNNVQLVLGKYIPYAAIGTVQALLLGVIVLELNIKPSNPTVMFAFLILLALSFDSIIYSFMSLFGLIGEGLAVVLLVLQLCSDSGTFPIEILPHFFQAISPYLPFTYAVEGIRELLFAVNINYSILQKDALILTVFGLIFMGLNIIFVRKGEIINEALEQKLAS